MSRPASAASISGLVLAGGQARRMGGIDKGLIPLAGRPMIEHVLEALQPQVAGMFINANRNRARYARYGVEVIADALDGFLGPLAGVASVLPRVRTPYLLTVPCDSPLLPPDLADRLSAALEQDDARIAVAHDGERQQPVFMLLDRSLGPDLLDYLAAGGRKIDQWFARHRVAQADLSDRRECFINVNDPEELARVEAMLPSNASPA